MSELCSNPADTTCFLPMKPTLRAFDACGFEAFRADWPAIDAYAGQRLRVRLQDGRTLAGTAAGIAPDGALQLSTRRGLRTVRNGRVVSAA